MPKRASRPANPPTASVHRFRDSVAVFVGDGATTYLTPAQALALAEALASCARDVTGHAFVASPFQTVNVD
jgi:hypothetical protein